jgi:hypothetical protein
MASPCSGETLPPAKRPYSAPAEVASVTKPTAKPPAKRRNKPVYSVRVNKHNSTIWKKKGEKPLKHLDMA